MNLESLREQLNRLDRQLLELAAQRNALASQIAEVKRAAGQPTRDYQREREVLLQAREHAARLGLSPKLAEALLTPLIHSSLATQEQARVAAQGYGSGKRALIIGAAGQMGRWFAAFLSSQGFAVEVADPAGPVQGYPSMKEWQDSALDHDLIVVATPLGLTRATLEQLAQRRPKGLIFDLGSLKTPLRQGLEALVAAGCKVTSIHPMFGPETELLSGRHMIFIDLGLPEPLAAARQLFAQTMVEQVVMTLDEHDRLIAFVLGLSHALNIAFFTALAESGEMAPRLAQLSSTTFDAQMEVARWVAVSNPVLYYEIQRLNDYGGDALTALKASVTRLCDIVAQGDEAAFISLMTRGKAYLEQRTLDGRNTARQHS